MAEAEVFNVDDILGKLRKDNGKNKSDLTENEIRELSQRSKEIFLKESSLLEIYAPLHVCGNIHGNYVDLLSIFEDNGEPPETSYLFLGGYVDKGRRSIDTICLLLAYKVKYPERIFLLRGTHESASINRVFGFLYECKRQYNVKLWKLLNACFDCLPVAAIINNKIFCCNGGLSPDLESLDQIRSIERPTQVPDVGLLCDLLWADPDKEIHGWGESDTGVSYKFGTGEVDKFLDKYHLDMICRSRQRVEGGYEYFANDKLVTLYTHVNREWDTPGAIMSIDDVLTKSFNIIRSVHTTENNKEC